jgi:hypothetical protein
LEVVLALVVLVLVDEGAAAGFFVGSTEVLLVLGTAAAEDEAVFLSSTSLVLV